MGSSQETFERAVEVVGAASSALHRAEQEPASNEEIRRLYHAFELALDVKELAQQDLDMERRLEARWLAHEDNEDDGAE